MPLNIDTFRNIANSTLFSSRDLAVQGQGETATARLGNFVFSQGAKTNDATMAAFKAALEKEYGVFGTHAFDTVLGSRAQTHKSLRASDVTATLSKLETVKTNRYIGELSRQLDTNPKFRELSDGMRRLVRSTITDSPVDGSLKDCATDADLARKAVSRIERAIVVAKDFIERKKSVDPKYDVDQEVHSLGSRQETEKAAKANEPTGLRRLKTVFGKRETSIEDQIKDGFLGAGMRVNRSNTNPVILDKLKTNGVEPGFIYRNDWSKDDTHGFMADVNSAESLAALESLKDNDKAFAKKCEGKTVREQILLAGRAHPAAMAVASELLIEEAAKLVRGEAAGKGLPALPGDAAQNAPDAVKALAKAIKNYFANANDIEKLSQISDGNCGKALLDEVKKNLFVDIRDAVMSMGPKNADGSDNALYSRTAVFKHFSDRAIVKLDYSESSKFSKGDTASAGTFMRPERVAIGRKMGQLYRFTSRQSADTISAGAVTEALANDLTRIAGVPSQELEIMRGEYSDGHPKIMLAAKFKEGYRDMEAGMLKDGRIVKPKGSDPNLKLESLGKYKAFFLLTADRDGVGKRGQNKGFAGGKFFAIDPGHSLEGNGKYLKVSDDFSFKDTYGKSSKPRFNNFSVFDDDTRFAKLSGLLDLRERANAGDFQKVFVDYRAAFNPNEEGISDAEKALRQKIVADIDAKEEEFNESLRKLLDVGGMQMELYDRLAGDGPAMQEKAVNMLSHLEMLTSPTTWVSAKGKVALNHLEVRPETRVPWRAGVDGENIVFHCDRKLDRSTITLLETVAKGTGATYSYDAAGVSRLVVPKAAADRVFAAFSEENVQKLTHPEEFQARMSGGNPLKVARDYKPVPFKAVAPAQRQLTADQLPEFLDVKDAEGNVVRYPKIHYQQLATGHSDPAAPRTVDQLREFLEARLKRGKEVLDAVLDGDVNRFEPSQDNIVCLTHALHAAALRQGQYMYRGAFSVRDPDGNIARWLDRADGLYARASTHAKPYHAMVVDGHRNEARGIDIRDDMRGLLNGMRTLHYFTIPDIDHLQNADGCGPKRRLYLKCETYGVFVNKISSANAKSSIAEGMKTRGYQFGDVAESIAHGLSLVNSYWTPKEAPGIQKENLLEAQKRVIDEAVRKLSTAGLQAISEKLLAGGVREGGGVMMLIDNIVKTYEHDMPEDPAQRAIVASVFDELIDGIAETTDKNLPGKGMKRMGNEIMID